MEKGGRVGENKGESGREKGKEREEEQSGEKSTYNAELRIWSYFYRIRDLDPT